MATTPDITLRRATVAFVDLLGAGPLAEAVGIERAYAIVTGGLRMLEGIARRHGAVIDKYLSDCLMAVFGFPLVTAEPEAAAVAAALEMQEAVARYERQVESPTRLELRIGINTGTMVAGDLQGPIVREFRVLGDPVNVAARLKDLGAPGAIHIGPETHEASQTRFRFEALEPLVLRGKRKLVPAFRVLGTAETADSASISSPAPATTSALPRPRRGAGAAARARRGAPRRPRRRHPRHRRRGSRQVGAGGGGARGSGQRRRHGRARRAARTCTPPTPPPSTPSSGA